MQCFIWKIPENAVKVEEGEDPGDEMLESGGRVRVRAAGARFSCRLTLLHSRTAVAVTNSRAACTPAQPRARTARDIKFRLRPHRKHRCLGGKKISLKQTSQTNCESFSLMS